MTDKCGKVSSLCPNAGNIAPAIYSLQLAVKTITARSLTWMIVDATEIPPGRREELTESGDEAEDLDYDMPVRADDSSDSACSVVSQLESAADNTDDSSSLACSEDGQDQAERSAPLPAGTFTIFNNGYFRLMRDPRYTDAKMWLSRKFATPGELGAKELSKTCQISDFDSSLEQTFLVLRSWMLWRCGRNNWIEKNLARKSWFDREMAKLKSDCRAQTLGGAAVKQIQQWTPQVLS